jgi:hypothetical protein
MSDTQLHLYMPPWLFDRVNQPRNIFACIAQAAVLAGWELVLHGEDDPMAKGGYHLLYNRPVKQPNTLVLRKCGFEPFFRIEATNDRWDWGIANTEFATDKGGEWFRKYWCDVLFKDQTIHAGGYVFMPLQSKLNRKRHFQTCTPLKMIEKALKNDPNRVIRATLHPRGDYSAAELDALKSLVQQSGGQFDLCDQPSIGLLAGCDYVVTQNSTMALIGMFAQKTPILFADIDFHHLAGSVPRLGLAQAYGQIGKPQRWGAYLHWYFKENAISMRDEAAPQAIVARLAALGWPIGA